MHSKALHRGRAFFPQLTLRPVVGLNHVYVRRRQPFGPLEFAETVCNAAKTTSARTTAVRSRPLSSRVVAILPLFQHILHVMMTEPRFLLADAELSREKAERLFERVREEIAPSLPPESDFRHIGATAIPNCLTKGDLDVAIRVRSEVFQTVDAFLAKRFARNAGSLRTDQFSAFEDSSSDPHLGIQLTVIGGPQDVFHLFAEALCQSPSLVSKYNLLKRRYNGADMASYRKAKDAFIEHVLAAASR